MSANPFGALVRVGVQYTMRFTDNELRLQLEYFLVEKYDARSICVG